MSRTMLTGLAVVAAIAAAGGEAQAGLFDLLGSKFGGPSKTKTYETAVQVEASSGPVIASPAQAEGEQPPLPAAPSDSAPSASIPEKIELYKCVSYDDRDEMHPDARPVVVGVPDPSSVKHPFYWVVGDAPCDDNCECCDACEKPLAYVEICVPPDCPVPAPCVSHHGRKHTYDFGRYSVDVWLSRDEIEVEYNN